jgi:hypothetical protein
MQKKDEFIVDKVEVSTPVDHHYSYRQSSVASDQAVLRHDILKPNLASSKEAGVAKNQRKGADAGHGIATLSSEIGRWMRKVRARLLGRFQESRDGVCICGHKREQHAQVRGIGCACECIGCSCWAFAYESDSMSNSELKTYDLTIGEAPKP